MELKYIIKKELIYKKSLRIKNSNTNLKMMMINMTVEW